ncbi:MAG: hypothetical protein SFU86_23470 [Pirellulaceae bacterium]|nr:hypothetical protein [Pirellulaceae bacterium]
MREWRIFIVVVSVQLTLVGGGLAYWLSRSPSAPNAARRAIREANRITLYEGLPHPVYEQALYQGEKKSQSIQILSGYDFYQSSRKVTQLEAEGLFKTLAAAETYAAWRGPKACGGFHPDFGVEVQSGSEKYLLLLCFGCREVEVRSKRSRTVFDLTNFGHGKLRESLQNYRDQRPTGSIPSALDRE